jgi:hypothetical protein
MTAQTSTTQTPPEQTSTDQTTAEDAATGQSAAAGASTAATAGPAASAETAAAAPQGRDTTAPEAGREAPRAQEARPTVQSSRYVPKPAAYIGAAGLIPFVATALAVWFAPAGWAERALEIQLFYGAVIISFLGAAHWGLALAGQGTEGDEHRACTWPRLGYSVAPALVAWVSLITAPIVALGIQLASFLASFLVDFVTTRVRITPRWYPKLRGSLTLVALICQGATLYHLLQAAGLV